MLLTLTEILHCIVPSDPIYVYEVTNNPEPGDCHDLYTGTAHDALTTTAFCNLPMSRAVKHVYVNNHHKVAIALYGGNEAAQ